MKLTDAVRSLNGVGPKREAAFAAHNIYNIGDLLWCLPTGYNDRKVRGTLMEESETAVTVEATVVKKGTILRVNSKLSLFVLPIEEINCNGHICRGEAVWFNQPWLQSSFLIDETYLFYGKIRQKGVRMQVLSPQFVPAANCQDFFTITPVYPKMEGIPPESLKKTILSILDKGIDLEDPIPPALRSAYHLLPLRQVLYQLHVPKDQGEIQDARYRLKFEEALKINLGIMTGCTQHHTKIRIHNFSQLKRFEAGLPFTLTSGQVSVLGDIIQDLETEKTMNRLILGDVGSGKTVIAMACAFLFALSGYQTAYMAPTEILAEQHAANFRKTLSIYGISVGFLAGGLKKNEKAAMLDQIEKGDVQIIIGTHALIQESVQYYHLGLVITDEQHRFGVKQRGRLALKGNQPHTLVMSATPIPRTLALVFYGDLDISVIDVMPEGRKRIRTFFYREKQLPQIYDFIEKEIKKGYQAMIVCPFIENSEEMDAVRDVGRVYAEVRNFYGSRCTAACLHGKLTTEEKQQIINAFYQKKIQILVATSIVEVGIDVRDVSVMVIMSADRFGLSQLHQLRGRAGRGDQQAFCFLVSNAVNERTIERMKVIVNHQNGQEIAEEDYRLRGAGDYFGSRQHGLPAFKMLDPFVDMELLVKTKSAAEEIFQSKQKEIMVYRSEIQKAFFKDTEIIMN